MSPAPSLLLTHDVIPADCVQAQGLARAKNVLVVAETVQWDATNSVPVSPVAIPHASTALASFNLSASGVVLTNRTILVGELWFRGGLDMDEHLDLRAITTVSYDANGQTADSSIFSLLSYDLSLVRSRSLWRCHDAWPAGRAFGLRNCDEHWTMCSECSAHCPMQ
jgi:hypothetical protein